ncbi:LamG domain-containing protein [Rheinheimera maricola]|uniref:LamG domain-containing protein n=1 Tax=Rheinheimera maricola TaxID=2793282 RepID=A0ABS7X3D2_9GAMM|nr:LamG domain-containing protein [Rheinheimera maricola]MBZ9610073.1 LamG domain-containing protein [Rheinheimera maricola]
MKLLLLPLLILGLLLSGCGGADVEQNPPPPVQEDNINYTGPAPQTEDIQLFKLTLWDNVASSNRCGACHVQGNTAPYFARNDDINLAYAAATPLVNLADPTQSLLVTKLAGGHNCWQASDSACADTMAQWLRNWANSADTEAATITLVAPPVREPGASKALPDDPTLFAATVHPLLRQYCVNCHAPDAAQTQAPFFADSDVVAAYDASRKLINLDSPELSRFVARLGDEFHNCWSDCAADAAEMLSAISQIADNVALTPLNPDLVPSKALRLDDGVVASSGGRFEANQIAFYQFKTGDGAIAYDTSGVEPAANLSLQGDISWVTGWGLQINSGRAQASTQNSRKLAQLITATGEMSIEAWLVPANVTQEGPAAIVSYAGSNTERNFTLGQSQYNYNFLLRSDSSDFAGIPALSTADAAEVLQATQQHVVLTQDPVNGRRIYVNGIDTGARDTASVIRNWDDTYALIVGNEANGNRQWQGTVRLLAVHNKALTAAQIQQNYNIGVGQKFYLLFGVGELIGLADSYIVFEVAQFDNYSYLFTSPYLINLAERSLPQALTISGMALGINGKEAVTGQAWITQQFEFAAGTDLSSAVTLSDYGTIIGTELGAASDEFFLSFGRIGEFEHVRTDSAVPVQQIIASNSQSSDIGLRTFAEIHASMSALTGVSQQQPAVTAVYQTIQRQLPSADNIDTFVSAQQMAITQLGIAYCNAAIDDTALRQTWFTQVDFSASPAITYSSANRSKFITPLLDRFMPLAPATSALRVDVTNELDGLIDRLSNCGGSCSNDRSLTIAKAACTAVLASAELLVQ